MINVLKRLQELDEQNPRVIKEAQAPIEECGIMGMGGMNQPHTPASINMTANSGPELTGMLKDIMSLAGLKPVGSDDLGNEPPPAVVSTEPGMSLANVDGDQLDNDEPIAGNDRGEEPFDMKSMVAKIDTLNEPADDQEEKVKEWDNEPVDDVNGELDNDAMLNTGMHNQDPAGNPGVGDRMDGDRPRAFAKDSTYESLMAEYQKYINEGIEEETPFYYNKQGVDKMLGHQDNMTAEDKSKKSPFAGLYGDEVAENEIKDAEKAHSKISTPAVQRKAQGGDWKVSSQDLEKEKARTGTSPEGLAAIKKLAGIK